MDQVAAQKIGQDTPLPSIELMIEEASVNCGDGLSCAYRDTISWQGPTSPLPMQNNPQVVFERLFGDGNTDAERRARRQQSLSLLDSVRGEASALQRRLPAIDRNRLDQYLTDVREIERRIQKAAQAGCRPTSRCPTRRPAFPKDVEEHIKLMFDLQVLAWQADITRVSTLLMAKELSNAVYSEERRPGRVPHPVAPLEHPGEQGSVRGAEPLPRRRCSPTCSTSCRRRRTATARCWITRWCCTAAPWATATSTITPLPIVLAGGASGRLKGGRHIRNPPETPMSNLLLAMLDKLGVPTEKFGDSTGMITI